jgi:ankyrin repeat protein
MNKTGTLLAVLLSAVNYAFGQTPNEKLYQAVVQRDTAAVRQALNSQADPNYVQAVGPWMKASVLTTAVNKRDIAVVKMLLARHANVNWKDGFNTSALMYAAALGNKELTLLLLAAGADVQASDGKGNTVLSAAQEGKNQDVIQLIQSRLVKRDKS